MHAPRALTRSVDCSLRHNVIKAGLRKLSVSYSRLSFQDVADKLHLGSAEDAEFVCAKVGLPPLFAPACARALSRAAAFVGRRPSETE